MRPVFVGGAGLWSPGYSSPGDWLEGRHDSSVIRPPCAMIDSRIKRHTSLVTRMATEAIGQAAVQSGANLGEVPMVFGSSNGEILTAFLLLDMIEADGIPSPARFMNSVHNTASGHVSISHGNTGFSTSLAAGLSTFAMCMLEAITWLELRGGSIMISVADESLPDHLSVFGRYDPLGLAFQLSADAPSAGNLGRLSNLRRECHREPPGVIPGKLRANPVAVGLLLLEALLRGRCGPVPVALDADGWCVDLLAPEAVS